MSSEELSKPSFKERIKARWGVDSDARLIKIFIMFAVTGSSVVWIRKPLFEALNLSAETIGWVYYPIRILSIFVIYQFMFLFMGVVFREYPFAKMFVGKMTKRFRPKKKEETE